MRNDDRPNGKAWKKKWGSNPPVDKAQADNNKTRRRKAMKAGKDK